ncbi:MAG: histidine phosphatase family protein [Lewinellaceae bacterium]|nr:histidine phosphatase family protein [Saprospiraceae bacterium]MCB9332065.1 histidine phosphatase family protein [Lewinellaceae bacterium]
MKLLAILALVGISLLFSCEKEPQVITETILKTDTLVVTQVDTVVVQLTDTLMLTEFIRDTATTFIILRHAETTGIGTDPGLSTAGQDRAAELVRVLKEVPLDAVYSTNFNRTRQTAQPVAADKSLGIQTYNAFAPDQLADGALAQYKQGTVLVVGHSNTVPELLNALTGTNGFFQLPESQYDHLFLVTVFEKGRAKVVHLRYGEPTP